MAKIEIISIEVVNDMENYPELSFPNCAFEIKYRVKENFAIPLENVTIRWRRAANPTMTSNLRLPRTEHRCNRIVGEYSQIISYHKVNDRDITNGDYGEIDIDIEYAIGAGVNDSTAKTFRRNMLLWEVGRPTEFRVRFEHGSSVGDDGETGNFVEGPLTTNVTARDLRGIVDRINNNPNPDRALKIAAFVGNRIIGYLDQKGIMGTVADAINLFQALNNRVNVNDNEISTKYTISRVRKWAQYRDRITGDWVNGYFLEKLYAIEHFSVSPELSKQLNWGRSTIISEVCYITQGYEELADTSLRNESNEIRRMALQRWRFNRLNGISNRLIAGHIITIRRTLEGSIAGATLGSSNISHTLYEIRNRVPHHQEPGDMWEDELRGVPGNPDVAIGDYIRVEVRR